MLYIFLASCFFSIGCIFADNSASQFAGFLRIIAEENHAIASANEFQYEKLSDLYASRGESYLIIGNNQEALKDFQTACEYAQLCQAQEESMPLIFRSLLGTFIASVCAEDLATAEKVCTVLEDILRNHLCSECLKMKIDPNLSASSFSKLAPRILPISGNHPDWPILGPDEIPVKDCLERVRKTKEAILILIAATKRAEIQALATNFINGLADQAAYCCRIGGIWKGCLQKLVNKLHYWKVLGVPADPAWDE